MDLIIVDGVNVKINPVSLLIKEFEALWLLDKDPHKNKAKRWFGYIKLYCDPGSPYQNLLEFEKRETIVDDLKIKLEDVSKPEFANAISKYEALYLSDEDRMMIAAKSAYKKIIDKLNSIDLDAVDEQGKPIHKIENVNAAFKSITEFQKTINEIQQGINLKKNKNKTVGGTTVEDFEDPKERIPDEEFAEEEDDFDTSDMQHDGLEPKSY
jgi:hypothetical protein